jgi:uncharacterized protein (DUF362 family)
LDDVRVTIADDPEASAAELLARVLDASGFWRLLATRCTATGNDPASLDIVIKPDLSAFSAGAPTATDPRLVEALVDLLHAHGYATVNLVAACDSSAIWAENRGVLALGELLGYQFATPGGHPYDIRDLADALGPVEFPAGAVLRGTGLSRFWTAADVRIVFAKNRTDEVEGYALALDSLLGLLPQHDKDYFYRHRVDAGTVAVELLGAAPPHFVLLDALVSGHGSGGGRAPIPLATRTLIASPSAVLADFAGALKMGVDPGVSRLTAAVLRAVGLPRRYRLDGNLAVYAGWVPVHPLALDAVRRRDASPSVGRALQPWLQQTDPASFPLKAPVDVRANDLLAARFSNIDADTGAFALYAAASYAIGLVGELLTSCRVLEDKDGLRRRHVPLGIDPADFSPADYEGPMTELEQLREVLRDQPRDAHGLRWRYVGQAVVFEIARVFPVPFAEFAAAVDVAKTIQFMNDYLGGIVVPVATDTLGRVTHQAERNLYLPQPNYLVLAGGEPIDVTKLEHVQYGEGRHRMSWRTIKSENGSAEYDDGLVTFSRVPDGTRVEIFGRQLFTLPPFWKAVNLDLMPTLKSALVTQAYVTFFQRTFSNFEALLDGREIRLGRAWHEPRDAADTEPLLTETVAQVVTDLLQRHGPAIAQALGRTRAAVAGQVDELGFSHFTSPPATAPAAGADGPDLAHAWAELCVQFAAALRRDFDSIGGEAQVKP